MHPFSQNLPSRMPHDTEQSSGWVIPYCGGPGAFLGVKEQPWPPPTNPSLKQSLNILDTV